MISKNNLLISLGKRIKELRKSQSYTQEDFAFLINKERQSLQRVEKGRVNPSIYYLYSIANGLNISLSELLSGVEAIEDSSE